MRPRHRINLVTTLTSLRRIIGCLQGNHDIAVAGQRQALLCDVREDYKVSKPHPEPYLTGLKNFGATKEETLVVEDSSRGLNSAVAAGIDCAIVYNDFTKSHDFSQASYRIATLIELKDIILSVT